MIKIELTNMQFNKLLAESESFRNVVTEIFNAQHKAEDPLHFWRNIVKKNFPDGDVNKIPPINWIRKCTELDSFALNLFEDCGFPYDKSRNILGLVSAKKFVESCF